jgi:hypothetical protein
MSVEEEVLSCMIQQDVRAAKVLMIRRELERIFHTPKCPYCCAPKGQPCHTRNGNMRASNHIPRTEALTERQSRRIHALYAELHKLTNGRL